MGEDKQSALFERHTKAVVDALRVAVTTLYLYDGAYIKNRSVRGGFYDIIEVLDKELFNELKVHGADWVFGKYFSEYDDE